MNHKCSSKVKSEQFRHFNMKISHSMYLQINACWVDIDFRSMDFRKRYAERRNFHFYSRRMLICNDRIQFHQRHIQVTFQNDIFNTFYYLHPVSHFSAHLLVVAHRIQCSHLDKKGFIRKLSVLFNILLVIGSNESKLNCLGPLEIIVLIEYV